MHCPMHSREANRAVTYDTRQNRESNLKYIVVGECRGEFTVHKITLFVATVAVLVLIGIGAWIGVRALTPTGTALAGASDQPPVTMMGAKGPPTSLTDDSLVVY
jgi:hypothetical protein